MYVCVYVCVCGGGGGDSEEGEGGGDSEEGERFPSPSLPCLMKLCNTSCFLRFADFDALMLKFYDIIRESHPSPEEGGFCHTSSSKNRPIRRSTPWQERTRQGARILQASKNTAGVHLSFRSSP